MLQQPRNLPAFPGKRLRQDLLLLVDVATVVAERRCGEEK
jgi:hypothetical protein